MSLLKTCLDRDLRIRGVSGFPLAVAPGVRFLWDHMTYDIAIVGGAVAGAATACAFASAGRDTMDVVQVYSITIWPDKAA